MITALAGSDRLYGMFPYQNPHNKMQGQLRPAERHFPQSPALLIMDDDSGLIESAILERYVYLLSTFGPIADIQLDRRTQVANIYASIGQYLSWR